MAIPQALNESKRSFYSDDEDLKYSPILETSNPHIKTVDHPKEKEIVSEFVDGHKIDSSSYLNKSFNSIRNKIIYQLDLTTAEFRNLKSAAKNEINNLTENITSVYDPKDEFLPNFIYALTTTLFGSILVNRKSLPVRFFTPLLFGLASFKFFLPLTFSNTANAIRNYESKEYPELLDQQRSFKNFILETESSLEKLSSDSNQYLIDTVRQIRESVTK